MQERNHFRSCKHRNIKEDIIMISAEKSVYISYSWKAEDKNDTVEKLLAAFSERGIHVNRDIDGIGYGNLIREYMDDLASGDAIILVLSKPYFESPNCMYELREIYLNNRKEFHQRIFPVVLKGTKFHRAIDRIPYIQFWEVETRKLETNLKLIGMVNISHSSLDELKNCASFATMIDELLSIIGDKNHWKEEDHLKDNFFTLIKSIFPDSSLSDCSGTDKTDQEENFSQDITGDGNIFSGSGNVTVEHITIDAGGTEPQPENTASPSSPTKLGMLFGVPNLPSNYMERPEYLDQFRAVLLSNKTQTHYIGIQGMAGLGKSVLAAALAHDESVRAAFPDGIFWLRFTQDIDETYLLEQQAEILKILAPDQVPDSSAHSEELFSLALQDKRCLFIADDLWDSKHLRHFVFKGNDCRFLLTTRNVGILQKIGAHQYKIDLISEQQARELLVKYSGYAEDALPKEATAILDECGSLPLAIAAIGSILKGNPADRWQFVLKKLQSSRLDKIPTDLNSNYGYENLFRAFLISVEGLPLEVQAYYRTLIIFPEGEWIPESVLQLYWEHYPHGDYEPLDAVDLLIDRSLISRANDELLTLHPLLRDCLALQSGGNISSLHKQLLDAYKAKYPGGWHTIPYEEPYYFYNNWSFHARESEDAIQAAAIAEDLIQHQPLLNHIELLHALKILGISAKEEAARLLKESQHPNVLVACLDILGEEGKEDARRLLKSSTDERLILACIRILGQEAEAAARQLIKDSRNKSIED